MSLKCFQSSSFCNFYSDWNFSFQFNFKFLRLKEINEDFPLLVCLNSTIWRIWNESWIFLKVKVFRENFSLCMFFSETKSYNLRNLNLNWKRPLPQIEGYQRKLLILYFSKKFKLALHAALNFSASRWNYSVTKVTA